jgi:hypothetical protein
MEKVLVVGPFNSAMKAALNEALSDKFELEYITSREEYGRLILNLQGFRIII